MNTNKLHDVLMSVAGGVLLFLVPMLCHGTYCDPTTNIQILESIDGQGCVPIGKGLATLFNYINQIFPWAIGVSAGLVVVWGVWSGGGMILNAGDDAKFKSEKDHFKASLIGLIVIIFSGAILATINANFFHAT
jgi:hypothetical protein